MFACEPDLKLVGETGDGDAVLDLVGAIKPAVLLLELGMPGAHLWEVVEKLRGVSETAQVVAIADNTAGSEVAMAREAGIGEVVMDGALTRELIAAIRRAVGRGAAPGRVAGSAQPQLSEREQKIATLVGQGLTNREIAEKLSISSRTVKNHMSNIFDKLDVSNRLELALYARGVSLPVALPWRKKKPRMRKRGMRLRRGSALP